MKIEMIYEISGLIDGKPWPLRGGIIDIDADEARRLIDQGAAKVPGKAEEKPAAPEVEAAVADEAKVETAAIDTAPKKRAARRV